MKPPTRLLSDPTVATELRSDLERSANAPPDYDVAAGLAAFQAAVAYSAATSIGTAAASRIAEAAHPPLVAHVASGLGLGAKLSLAASAVVASVGLSWAAATHSKVEPKRSPPSAAQVATHPRALPPVVPPSPAPALAPTPAPSPSTPVEITPTFVPPSHAGSSKHVANGTAAVPGEEQLRREIAQLGQIKQLLPTDPAQAYQLALAGHREFRGGMLRQEREALVLTALWKLGRRDAARAGVHRFLLRYPTSPMRERLLDLVASGGD